ncbi:MAG: GntR family transcriptional regulator [Muribaculaceae bacterium]|nr:GntR family transcriptional regulator [Muribaculaceae bacterium]
MKIGEYNELTIRREAEQGLYLADADGNEVLLPRRYVTTAMAPGQTLRVMVYTDSEDRPVATTDVPKATVGQFALMRVNQVNPVGAFLDWGLAGKELLVPFREQRVTMQAGRSYVVRVYLDEASRRVVASAKLDRFVGLETPDYYHRQRVDALIVQRTDLGFKVIVDGKHWGLLYDNELRHNVNVGEHHTAFVKRVRPDGKIDLTMNKIERLRVEDIASNIMQLLHDGGGTLALTDRSTPEQIANVLGCSKKDFKKAVGLLYRQHLVTINDADIKLVK